MEADKVTTMDDTSPDDYADPVDYSKGVERQHVSDSAWQRYEPSEGYYTRDGLERVLGKTGVMLVTVEEFDSLAKHIGSASFAVEQGTKFQVENIALREQLAEARGIGHAEFAEFLELKAENEQLHAENERLRKSDPAQVNKLPGQDDNSSQQAYSAHNLLTLAPLTDPRFGALR